MSVQRSPKILIVKIGAIGDVVMALPMLKRLRDSQPDALITWMGGRSVVPLVKLSGLVDEVVSIDDKAIFSSGFWAKVVTVAGIWRRLFLRSFDFIIVGHADFRYRLLILSCRKKLVRSFARNTKQIWPIPGRHHSDEYIRLADGVDGPSMAKEPLPELPALLPAELEKFVVSKGYKGLVAIAPGGAKNGFRDDFLRRWPLENYASLAKILVAQGYRVLVTGGPSDEWVCEAFSGMDVDLLVGKTSILDLVALFKRCDLVVTHDSGPLHLAGLAGVKILGLFGPTNPEEKLPRSAGTICLWGGSDMACRPCYDGRNYGDCLRSCCLEQISVAEVLQKIISILEK